MMMKWLSLPILIFVFYLTVFNITAAAFSFQFGKINRRSFVNDSFGFITTIAGSVALSPAFAADESGQKEVSGVTVYKTKSGLQYIELEKGSGPSPMYGQLVSITFTAYMQLPNKKEKEKFDSDSSLFKHGSARMIAGLDEGLHTMKVGGKRRMIIPPKLGFVTGALGPVPQSPLARMKLNQLLDKMVEVRGGNLIYDVELKLARDDEADQGYYTDTTLSDEEMAIIQGQILGPSS
mmetsp:Transcript_18914/g.21675  ORF Transcript_18914/g.21675 Transcript_18914/m.21675 type:complete len:236 (-) Transcript_18914:268-975(-)